MGWGHCMNVLNCLTQLRKQIENAVAQMTGNEFDRMDLCLKALQLSFGPYSVKIYKSEEIHIPAGPVILVFRKYGAVYLKFTIVVKLWQGTNCFTIIL